MLAAVVTALWLLVFNFFYFKGVYENEPLFI